jgi:CDP-paratose 2-epimerase
MNVLITGVCGFVGSRLALALLERFDGMQVFGIDNLSRAGSEGNRSRLSAQGIRFIHGDLRSASDVEGLPACDWVIDAAANPSVLAGVDGKASPRQLYEHNLDGTLNILEYCRKTKAGLFLLSSSRVYSVRGLAALPMEVRDNAFRLQAGQTAVAGVTELGISEQFSVRPPISLYGATKLSSEIMALEYGSSFDFPVWINRCGVLAGAGQFGTAEQGIFSYWLHAHAARLPLRYIGFEGKGYQVRDAFHPEDLAELISMQMRAAPAVDEVFNVAGGVRNSMSLAQLTAWCDERFGGHAPQPDTRPRPFDIPWMVMDYTRVQNIFGWAPKRSLWSILDEIAEHVRDNPAWLTRTGAL